MTNSQPTIYGVDPAPGKGLTIWSADGLATKKPLEAKSWLDERVQSHQRMLIAWDAPISFDSSISYYDRPIEIVMREFFNDKCCLGRFEKKTYKKREPSNMAVSVQPFSGCSHWAITCDVLGRPFSCNERRIAIANTRHDVSGNAVFVIEVHPAVTLGLWWLERNISGPMPAYKGRKKKSLMICDKLKDLVPDCVKKKIEETIIKKSESKPSWDDILDAFVAYRMAEDFMKGDAIWVGNPVNGGFVLPKIAQSKYHLGTKVKTLINGLNTKDDSLS